ncbi:MAG TPA: hypothetical protein HPQ04_08350 [Rhodospirillaceae bacterium]|nr:hypothetical protein [Rhodospirillaceae bacterium]
MTHLPRLGTVVIFTGLACASIITCGQALLDRAAAIKVEQLRRQLAASVEIFQARYGYLPGESPAVAGTVRSAWADLAASGLVDQRLPAVRGISGLSVIVRNGHLDLVVEGTGPGMAAALKDPAGAVGGPAMLALPD